MKTTSTLFTLLLVFVGATDSWAIQEKNEDYRPVSGKVVDLEQNNGIEMANVSIKGTNIKTITNTEGSFLIKVPLYLKNAQLEFTAMGYDKRTFPLTSLQSKGNKIELQRTVTLLEEVNITGPRSAKELVMEIMENKSEKYSNNNLEMTAFYRETIKKRNRNASLAEAVVKIYKTPYDITKHDLVSLYKVRKSTDYNKLDTLALKLQGGPFNALYIDIVKYPEYLFVGNDIEAYDFKYAGTKTLNGKQLYQIDFIQKATVEDPMYKGYLMIAPENKTLHSASFALNITDKQKAAELFVRKKPKKVEVWPTEVTYTVNYNEQDGKWLYNYSQVNMSFKVDWKGKLFNSNYSMKAEMAVTDWDLTPQPGNAFKKEKIRQTIVLADDVSGFADPEF